MLRHTQGTATSVVNTGQQLLATSRQLHPQLQQLAGMAETSKQLRAHAERLKQLAATTLGSSGELSQPVPAVLADPLLVVWHENGCMCTAAQCRHPSAQLLHGLAPCHQVLIQVPSCHCCNPTRPPPDHQQQQRHCLPCPMAACMLACLSCRWP